MIRGFTIAFILAAAAGTALAADDPTADRQAMMKNMGAATGAGAKMLKGETEFNVVAAQIILHTMNSTATGFPYLFPVGSETGNDTEASPQIWEDREGFNTIAEQLAADTAVTVTDMESFQAAFGAATKNCGTCHKAYRIMKN